jgi:hypothetical protein
MKDNTEEKNQPNDEIEDALDAWEKENETRRDLHKKMQQDINIYFKQGFDKQKGYKENIDHIINIKNTKQCEELINKIAKDIPAHIIMNMAHPLMQNIVEESKEKTKKVKELNLEDDEAVKKVLSKEQRDKALKFDKEEKQLRGELDSDFEIMTNTIFPLMMFSRDQWSFLWNLASWKSNLLLTKQMKNYTYWVMVLTGVVVFFTIILVIVSFIK